MSEHEPDHKDLTDSETQRILSIFDEATLTIDLYDHVLTLEESDLLRTLRDTFNWHREKVAQLPLEPASSPINCCALYDALERGMLSGLEVTKSIRDNPTGYSVKSRLSTQIPDLHDRLRQIRTGRRI